jgi:SAM-dependent methyltransferase
MKIKKSNLVRLLALELSFLLLAGCASVASLQVKRAEQNQNANAAAPTPNDEINRPRSEPYTGELSIFEDPKREENLQISRVMDILKIKDSANVADIGAGSGWFTTRAAKRTKGAVYAVEINQDYINYINDRAKKENLANIKTVLGKEDDPLLPEKSIDAVLILKTYHEIGAPIRLMKNLKKSLRKGALVGIIDRSGKGDDHGIDSAQVVKEMEQAGFALNETYDFVKSEGIEYFLVFRVK